MILDTTLRKIEMVLGEAATTALTASGSFYDSGATPSGGPVLLSVTTTAAATLVAAPAANFIRQVNELSITNNDNVAHNVTVQYNDNGTLYTIQKVLLSAGYSLNYNKNGGWVVLSNTGSINFVPVTGGTFDSGIGDTKVQINKLAAANAATVLFKDGSSGRAEEGLFRDDNYHLRVSTDGTTWLNAVTVLGASGQFQYLSGSAAAPSLAIAGSAGTGIFSPAADVLSFATAGIERARIDSAGNFRVGSTAFGDFITFYKNQNANTNVIVNNDNAGTAASSSIGLATNESSQASRVMSTGSLYNFSPASAFDPPNIANSFNVIGARGGGMNLLASNGPIRFYTMSAAALRGIIDTTGNWGINTSSPTGLLDINGGTARIRATTVAGLPAATNSGQIAFVTDSTQTAAAGLGTIVTGGGTNFNMVYADGTNWRIV